MVTAGLAKAAGTATAKRWRLSRYLCPISRLCYPSHVEPRGNPGLQGGEDVKLETEYQRAVLEVEARWVQAIIGELRSGELTWSLAELMAFAASQEQ
jgi:hypothetical protein